MTLRWKVGLLLTGLPTLLTIAVPVDRYAAKGSARQHPILSSSPREREQGRDRVSLGIPLVAPAPLSPRRQELFASSNVSLPLPPPPPFLSLLLTSMENTIEAAGEKKLEKVHEEEGQSSEKAKQKERNETELDAGGQSFLLTETKAIGGSGGSNGTTEKDFFDWRIKHPNYSRVVDEAVRKWRLSVMRVHEGLQTMQEVDVRWPNHLVDRLMRLKFGSFVDGSSGTGAGRDREPTETSCGRELGEILEGVGTMATRYMDVRTQLQREVGDFSQGPLNPREPVKIGEHEWLPHIRVFLSWWSEVDGCVPRSTLPYNPLRGDAPPPDCGLSCEDRILHHIDDGVGNQMETVFRSLPQGDPVPREDERHPLKRLDADGGKTLTVVVDHSRKGPAPKQETEVELGESEGGIHNLPSVHPLEDDREEAEETDSENKKGKKKKGGETEDPKESGGTVATKETVQVSHSVIEGNPVTASTTSRENVPKDIRLSLDKSFSKEISVDIPSSQRTSSEGTPEVGEGPGPHVQLRVDPSDVSFKGHPPVVTSDAKFLRVKVPIEALNKEAEPNPVPLPVHVVLRHRREGLSPLDMTVEYEKGRGLVVLLKNLRAPSNETEPLESDSPDSAYSSQEEGDPPPVSPLIGGGLGGGGARREGAELSRQVITKLMRLLSAARRRAKRKPTTPCPACEGSDGAVVSTAPFDVDAVESDIKRRKELDPPRTSSKEKKEKGGSSGFIDVFQKKEVGKKERGGRVERRQKRSARDLVDGAGLVLDPGDAPFVGILSGVHSGVTGSSFVSLKEAEAEEITADSAQSKTLNFGDRLATALETLTGALTAEQRAIDALQAVCTHWPLRNRLLLTDVLADSSASFATKGAQITDLIIDTKALGHAARLIRSLKGDGLAADDLDDGAMLRWLAFFAQLDKTQQAKSARRQFAIVAMSEGYEAADGTMTGETPMTIHEERVPIVKGAEHRKGTEDNEAFGGTQNNFIGPGGTFGNAALYDPEVEVPEYPGNVGRIDRGEHEKMEEYFNYCHLRYLYPNPGEAPPPIRSKGLASSKALDASVACEPFEYISSSGTGGVSPKGRTAHTIEAVALAREGAKHMDGTKRNSEQIPITKKGRETHFALSFPFKRRLPERDDVHLPPLEPAPPMEDIDKMIGATLKDKQLLGLEKRTGAENFWSHGIAPPSAKPLEVHPDKPLWNAKGNGTGRPEAKSAESAGASKQKKKSSTSSDTSSLPSISPLDDPEDADASYVRAEIASGGGEIT